MASKKKNYTKFEEFFSNEYHALRAYVNSKISQTAERDADDIIQELALKIFSREDNLSPINNIAGFVYNSIRNKIIDIMRTKKEQSYIDDLLSSQIAELVEQTYDESERVEAEKRIAQLKIAISELKPIYQTVIIAIDFEGYSYKELSLETGIPEGTLLSRHHRAIALLYKYLENYQEFNYLKKKKNGTFNSSSIKKQEI